MKQIQQRLPSLQADVLGELDEDTGLAYFRGIPYATVNKRWTHSQTQHTLDSPFDATNFGPRCVQPEGEVLVTGGVNDPTPGDDEFKCLNLNITVPREYLKSLTNGHAPSLLPVMVWIHGFGANSVARYRPGMLSTIAKEAGHPVVLVQIGYRLGALGFAASNDLESELCSSPTSSGANKHVPEALLGNYGLVDQINAFEWVRDHIHDLGGDSKNVTAFGISAGSASVHFHLLTGKPLFDRAICMSGSGPTLGPLPFERYENAWQELCQKTGTLSLTTKQRLDHLRAMKPLDLLNSYSSAAMGAMADGKLFPRSWTFEHSGLPTRCNSIILGDSRVEGIILDGLARRTSQARFQELIRASFNPTDAKDFSKYFGFSSPNVPFETYRDAIRRFLSIMMFQFSNLRIAEEYAPAGQAYLYHFEEPSPYPGPTFGLPYHGQCALFMYNNDIDTYSAGARHTAQEMARIWTAFAHGKQPWTSYSKAQSFMRFGPEGDIGMRDMTNDDLRDYGYVDWLKAHFDSVKAFAQVLLGNE